VYLESTHHDCYLSTIFKSAPCYEITYKDVLKGLVHPKMKILSVFTHPLVVPNLYVFICSAELKGR